MQVTWIKQRDATEKGDFQVMITHDEQKKFFTFTLNKPLEVEDEVGYLILGDPRFKGLFKQEGVTPKVGKSLAGKGYANKSASADAEKSA